MFAPHPSAGLTRAFVHRPWQGAAPETARFLFVGLDANYAAHVESSPVFAELLHYHEDGPAFWRTHGVHHPFLLPRYGGDGRRYHRTFAKIGFGPEHADLVSFAELMHLPTVGRSQLVPGDLDAAHLQRLRHWMFESDARFVFVSAGVLRLMATTGLFAELATATRSHGTLRVLHEDADRTVFQHLHFSNYGKFEQQLQAEAHDIQRLLAHVEP